MIDQNLKIETEDSKADLRQRYFFVSPLSRKYNFTPKNLRQEIKKARICLKKIKKKIEISGKRYSITKKGIGPITTKHGKFYQLIFEVEDSWKNYYVIVKAQLDNRNMLPKFDPNEETYLRIDSGCSTGQLFGDLTCECKKQLDNSLNLLGKQKQGLIIHIPSQDGRGRGTEFKLATLYLQDVLGINTVESFKLLNNNNLTTGLDSRDYAGTVAILKFLGINGRITLLTNNPYKIDSIRKGGIECNTKSILIKPTKLTKKHLIAKKEVLGHRLNIL